MRWRQFLPVQYAIDISLLMVSHILVGYDPQCPPDAGATDIQKIDPNLGPSYTTAECGIRLNGSRGCTAASLSAIRFSGI